MELEELLEAVKEAVDEKIQPINDRLAALEDAGTKAADGDDGDDGSDDDTDDGDNSAASNGAEISDDLMDAVKEAIKEEITPLADELDEFKDGLNKIVGASKSVVGQDGDDGDGEGKSSTKSAPRRDAWGRSTRNRGER